VRCLGLGYECIVAVGRCSAPRLLSVQLSLRVDSGGVDVIDAVQSAC
jgi:hypothetical protein